MDLILAVLALVAAGVGVYLAKAARAAAERRGQEDRTALDAARTQVALFEQRLAAAEAELRALREGQTGLPELREQVAELRSFAAAPPPPPLPKARSHGLDDLRERLRAAQQEGDGGDDE